MSRTWRIGEVAERTGLTRRTLRHYDELGLLVPSARSWGDYRLYDEDDLLRLLQIQSLKALGLSLPEVAGVLADPAMNAAATLRSHLAHLEDRIEAEARLADRLRTLAGAAERSWEDVLDAISLTQALAHPDPDRAAAGCAAVARQHDRRAPPRPRGGDRPGRAGGAGLGTRAPAGRERSSRRAPRLPRRRMSAA